MPLPDVVNDDRRALDASTIERIAAGDEDAMGELYDRYARVVFGVLYRSLGSPEVAEEVLQDTFHSVWRQAGTYRAERGAVRTWLLAIGRNAAIDWRRTKGKRIERETDLDAVRSFSGGDDVVDTVIAGMRGERVRSALESLPAEQRDVLALAFWGGLSQSEIATRTATPLGTVKSRVRLAMSKLRDRLGDDEGAS